MMVAWRLIPSLLIAALPCSCGGSGTGNQDAGADTTQETADGNGEEGLDAPDDPASDGRDSVHPDPPVDMVTDADGGSDASEAPVPCEGSADCGGGPCSQGFCCDEECPGTTCARCDLPGREGHCVRLDGNPCDDDDGCTVSDRCLEGLCVAGAYFCEGRPCENCLGEQWHEDLGDWCVQLGDVPMCFCLCE